MMQIAQRVDAKFSKTPELYRTTDYRMKFMNPAKPKPKLTKAEQDARVKAIQAEVIGRVAGKGGVTVVHAPIPDWIKKWLNKS